MIPPNLGVDPTPGKPRLLLVEDDPALGGFLHMMLQTEYRVNLTTDGQQAYDATLSEMPDLILSDIRMPGLSGIELTRLLRANPASCGVPIILLSGCNRPQTRAEGMEAGANEFMLKPFRPAQLLACLRAHSPH